MRPKTAKPADRRRFYRERRQLRHGVHHCRYAVLKAKPDLASARARLFIATGSVEAPPEDHALAANSGVGHRIGLISSTSAAWAHLGQQAPTTCAGNANRNPTSYVERHRCWRWFTGRAADSPSLRGVDARIERSQPCSALDRCSRRVTGGGCSEPAQQIRAA